MINKHLPNTKFKTRVRDDTLEGDNPFTWETRTVTDYFENTTSVLFSLPGAFTPTCSTFQLPDFERLYDRFVENGITNIYCISVNDAFVMNKWGQDQGVKNVKLIPDGCGSFTRRMGMLVAKDNLGFGYRSWRYAAVVDNMKVTHWFEEPGILDNCEDDPYGETSQQNILSALK